MDINPTHGRLENRTFDELAIGDTASLVRLVNG